MVWRGWGYKEILAEGGVWFLSGEYALRETMVTMGKLSMDLKGLMDSLT